MKLRNMLPFLCAILVAATCAKKQQTPSPEARTETPPPATEPAPQPSQPATTGKPFSYEFGPFRYKSSSLDDIRPALERRKNELRQAVSNLPPDARLTVRGHADASGPEEPVGKKPGNIALSQKRAQAVATWITQTTGLPGSRMVIEAKGSSQPKNPQKPKAAENRRVEVIYSP